MALILDEISDVVVDVRFLVVCVVVLVLVVVGSLLLLASVHYVIVVGVELTIDVFLVVQVECVRLVSFRCCCCCCQLRIKIHKKARFSCRCVLITSCPGGSWSS